MFKYGDRSLDTKTTPIVSQKKGCKNLIWELESYESLTMSRGHIAVDHYQLNNHILA